MTRWWKSNMVKAKWQQASTSGVIVVCLPGCLVKKTHSLLAFSSSLWKVCVSIHDKWGWGLTNVHHKGKHNLVSQSQAAGEGQGGNVLCSESFHGLTQKLYGLQQLNFMISYVSSPVLSSYCVWGCSNSNVI